MDYADEEQTMSTLSRPDIAQKIAHIAMKVFPPQARVAPVVDDADVGVRVSGTAAGGGERNIYIRLAPELLAAYEKAEALQEVRYDEYIEADLTAKAEAFNAPAPGVGGDGERWMIFDAPAPPAAARDAGR